MDLKGAVAGGRLPSQAPSRWGLLGPGQRRCRPILRVLAAAGLIQLAFFVPSAAAGSHAAPNPSSNYAAGRLPASCGNAPTGGKCINTAVYYLDQARARIHLAPYKLPGDFVKLAPDLQVLILSNLDRAAYHLPAITGLTRSLDTVAMGGSPGDPGVKGDGDPALNAPGVQTTSNWAEGFPNIVLAYEAWMYDDGYGSGNLDCRSPHASGCWGHRQGVLKSFSTLGPSAMGVAAGKDSSGARGYAMLIAKGHSSYTRSYSYRWTQAVADGAGTHNYRVKRPDTRTISISSLSLQGSTLTVYISVPKGISLKCSLSRRQGAHWSASHFRKCGRTTKFQNVDPGEYRVRVRSSLGNVSEIIRIS